MATIRPETPADRAAVRALLTDAFGRSGEADLVDALREAGISLVSLVAEENGRVLGHVLFTPVRVEAPDGASSEALALGPMAVAPDEQRRGLGSELVRRGLGACREAGHELVFVLGHPSYYPRFGFGPASSHGFRCKWPVPDEVFMVVPLRDGAASGRGGHVHYRPEFDSV